MDRLKDDLKRYNSKGLVLLTGLAVVTGLLVARGTAAVVTGDPQQLVVWLVLALIVAKTSAQHPLGFFKNGSGASFPDAFIFLAVITLGPYYGSLLGVVDMFLPLYAGAGGQGERLREGLRVAIAGPPNAGKSTLFNRLARREAAIVSPFPGTTRDVLELHLDLRGYPVTVLDTAGIRDTDDPVEREGVRRASEQAAGADLVLWVVDAAANLSQAALPVRAEAQAQSDATCWIVVNKIDLVTADVTTSLESGFETELTVHSLSSKTATGVAELVNALTRFAEHFFTAEPALVTRARQRGHLTETVAALRDAQQAAGSPWVQYRQSISEDAVSALPSARTARPLVGSIYR